MRVLSALLVLIPTLLSSRQPARATQPLALTNARVFDGTGRPAIESATLVVDNGKVVAVGPAARVRIPPTADRVDMAGRTITPGFINAHGHVGETLGLQQGARFNTEENVRRQLQLYASYGVTTVFSLGGDGPAGFAIRSQAGLRPNFARLFVAGAVITARTADEARAAVNREADRKPDIIKIRVDDNLGTSAKMSPEVYRAVIEAAHARRLRVAAHVYYREDAKDLLKAGINFIAHSIRDQVVDAETIALFKQRGVCLCPTLTRELSTFVYESRPAFFDDPFFLRGVDRAVVDELSLPASQERYRTSKSGQIYKTQLGVARENLKRLIDAEVPIAMGTDSGPPARFQGYFEHLELEMMAEAGLTPAQVLHAATGQAARCLQVAGRLGTLEPGAWADFLVFRNNPLADVRETRSLDSVWIGGVRLSP